LLARKGKLPLHSGKLVVAKAIKTLGTYVCGMLQHLIILIRNPQLGKVKTRLAATVGDERALEVYRKLLAITRTAALGADCESHLHYSDRIDLDDVWPNAYFSKYVQQGEGLGERMLHAFTLSFANGAERAIVVGSDCPELTSSLINAAFNALDGHDAVIGPADDGGYYLLGMKRPVPDFFERKQWSTATVLADTLADAQRLGLKVQLMPMLSDLDNEVDLIRSGL
jgi:rSAM/selenodomain-associated transferase 1